MVLSIQHPDFPMSIAYYDANARQFYEGTIAVDMSPIYAQFLPRLPEGARILDAGCGSGRDSLYFLDQQCKITAMDACAELANLATYLIGQPVQVCSFDEFTTSDHYDAIWACASLLHVARARLPATIAHLARFLHSGGLFYCSFKYGTEEQDRDGRHFTDMTEHLMEQAVAPLSLTIDSMWQSRDMRAGRTDERWLNVLLVKP